MNAVIFYFSGTGNTWWACSQLKDQLEKLSCTTEMFSLENPALQQEGFVAEKIAAADHVIIGYPIYGSDLPENMKNFLAALPDGKGKKFSSFCTQAGFSGDGCWFFRKEIEKKGYDFRLGFWINLTTNFNVAIFPFSRSRPASGKKLEKKTDKAAAKLAKMAGKIARDKKHIEGKMPIYVLMGHIQRLGFRKQFKKLPGKFQFFADRCIKCGRCVNNCPTQNIELDTEKPELKWKDNCLLCFRCYNFCPNAAINFGGKIKDPEKYIRYPGPVEKMDIENIKK